MHAEPCAPKGRGAPARDSGAPRATAAPAPARYPAMPGITSLTTAPTARTVSAPS